MGLKMTRSPEFMELQIEQIGERAMKGMSEVMRRHAIRIRDLARDYAPIKTGLLENAIDYDMVKVGRRNSYVVFIDLDATKTTGKEGNVTQLGDYAFLMEEGLRPLARKGRVFNLGTLSRAKAATGKKVGGRFLARAVADGTRDVLGDAAKEVRRATSTTGTSVVGTRYQRSSEGDDE
jgi:hypothetical protein